MNTHRDVIIIGAGPAGLSAAVTAAGYGLDVLVVDEQPSPGGQIYRNIERASEHTLSILGPDYGQGLALLERFGSSQAEYLGNAIVWRIDPNGNICFSRKGRSREINARHILIATGAMERPVPFAGWTLPGVMGVGAVDANFKSSDMVPRGPVVIAGSGPLLLATAGHLISCGVAVTAILDTTDPGNILSCLPVVPKALRRPDYLLKGLGMIVNLQRSGIRHVRGVTEYQAHGSDCLDHVSFKSSRASGTLAAGVLLVHEGVVPRCDLTRQVGIAHLWDPVQRCWYPKTMTYGRTEMKTIHVAGDGAFVHGGVAAQLKGSLAALDIAAAEKTLPQQKKNGTFRRIQQELYRELAPRPFVDALYQPRPNLYSLPPDTLVCRCEAVTAGDISQAIAEGCRDPNEIKAMTRCGMGPCQGRMCGSALAEITADFLKLETRDLNSLSIRPPVCNISLAELADLSLLETTPP
ncbi:MAG: FAD-dependent oxidoreductase [bacterium]|nr:FAD-dependent oxidoreductase [bacterium]